uniref:ATP-dependent DNA helicase n=1 Tax=Macrostomum lignano TaxID=282301 RepID=A0A1I8FEZ1_9PLAT
MSHLANSGGTQYTYYHEEDREQLCSAFQRINNAQRQRRERQRFSMAGATGLANQQLSKAQLRMKQQYQKKWLKQTRQNQEYQRRPQRAVNRESSVQVQRVLERVSTKSERKLQRVNRRDPHGHHHAGSGYPQAGQRARKGNHPGPTLMCCTRKPLQLGHCGAENSATLCSFDKREGSDFDLLTVHETAADQTLDDSANGLNSAKNLALEATFINHNFSQQCCATVTRNSHSTIRILSLRTRKRRREVPALAIATGPGTSAETNSTLWSAASHDAVTQGPTRQVQFINIKALERVRPRACRAPLDWRQQDGLAAGSPCWPPSLRTTPSSWPSGRSARCGRLRPAQAGLRTCPPRETPKDSSKHVILGTQQFKPNAVRLPDQSVHGELLGHFQVLVVNTLMDRPTAIATTRTKKATTAQDEDERARRRRQRLKSLIGRPRTFEESGRLSCGAPTEESEEEAELRQPTEKSEEEAELRHQLKNRGRQSVNCVSPKIEIQLLNHDMSQQPILQVRSVERLPYASAEPRWLALEPQSGSILIYNSRRAELFSFDENSKLSLKADLSAALADKYRPRQTGSKLLVTAGTDRKCHLVDSNSGASLASTLGEHEFFAVEQMDKFVYLIDYQQELLVRYNWPCLRNACALSFNSKDGLRHVYSSRKICTPGTWQWPLAYPLITKSYGSSTFPETHAAVCLSAHQKLWMAALEKPEKPTHATHRQRSDKRKADGDKQITFSPLLGSVDLAVQPVLRKILALPGDRYLACDQGIGGVIGSVLYLSSPAEGSIYAYSLSEAPSASEPGNPLKPSFANRAELYLPEALAQLRLLRKAAAVSATGQSGVRLAGSPAQSSGLADSPRRRHATADTA